VLSRLKASPSAWSIKGGLGSGYGRPRHSAGGAKRRTFVHRGPQLSGAISVIPGVRRLFTVAAAVAVAVALLPAGAQGATSPSKYLWATINICDTLQHPNQMGVRASMPGNGEHQRMYMRFQAQFYNEATKRYQNVLGSGLSGWIYAGSARYRFRQAGFTFSFDPPAPGANFTLRGLVSFQWRARQRTKSGHRRWVVVRKLRRVTKGGREGVHGADPPGFSSGVCQIR
jgi:hypothetical protein